MLSDIRKKHRFKVFRFSFWHLIMPVSIGLLITLVAYPQGFSSVKIISFVVIYSLAIGVPSMKGFEYIEWKLEQKISWLKRPSLRFFLTDLLEITLGLLIFIIVNYLFFIVIQKQDIDVLYSKTYDGLKYLIIFTIAGVTVINSSYFLKSWKQAAVNEEKLKKEKLAIEYEALKNQVNPHFLFNSLTALSSLVYSDQQKAVTFIREFSNTFRYVLESHEKEVVDFLSEKKLLESVSYLYQVRYEDALQIKIDLPDATDKFLIPMSLQMLLENAVKHNAISSVKPLMVEISEEEGYVVVKNNLQPKKSEIVSSKIGLNNIKSRYKYLSDKEVLVEISEENFVVKIPVLSKKDV